MCLFVPDLCFIWNFPLLKLFPMDICIVGLLCASCSTYQMQGTCQAAVSVSEQTSGQ